MTIAALYKTFSGWEWLEASIRSVIDRVHLVVVVDSQVPWRGVGRNQCTPILKRLKQEFGKKIVLIEDNHLEQQPQVMRGINWIKEKAKDEYFDIDWIMYVDSDEVWDDENLIRAITYLDGQQDTAWRCQMYTYVKSPFYRVEPVERLKPVIFVPTSWTDFGHEARSCDRPFSIMPNVFMHHFAYVRADLTEILVKLINSHYVEDNPTVDLEDWIFNKWGMLPNCQDFHPAAKFTTMWKEIKRVTIEDLPDVLRKKEYVMMERYK